jgi:hypothetical protein
MRCLYNNPRGIDLSLATTTTSNIQYKLYACISVLYATGTMIFRFSNNYDEKTAQLIYLSSQCFKTIELFKSAATPCDSNIIYLIGYSRKTDQRCYNILDLLLQPIDIKLTSKFIDWFNDSSQYFINYQIESIKGIDQMINRENQYDLIKCATLWRLPVAIRS